jgi:hypothetical protein
MYLLENRKMRKHKIVDAEKTEDGKREIDLCNSPENCSTCLMVLRIIETEKIESFVYSRGSNDAYVITFKIEPTPDYILFQNFTMIEDLIFGFFKEVPDEYDVEFPMWNLGLSIRLIPEHHFTYPLMEIRLFILGQVSESLLLQLRRIALQDVSGIIGKSGVVEDISNLADKELVELIRVRRASKGFVSSILSNSSNNPYGTENMRTQLKFLYHFPFHTIDSTELRNPNFEIKTFHSDVYGITDITESNG